MKRFIAWLRRLEYEMLTRYAAARDEFTSNPNPAAISVGPIYPGTICQGGIATVEGAHLGDPLSPSDLRITRLYVIGRTAYLLQRNIELNDGKYDGRMVPNFQSIKELCVILKDEDSGKHWDTILKELHRFELKLETGGKPLFFDPNNPV